MKYIQKDNYEATQLDDEWIIINTENFTVTKLNEIGGFCWSLLTEAQSVESIINTIKKNYVLSNPTIQQDIEIFLSNLIKCGLIENAS